MSGGGSGGGGDTTTVQKADPWEGQQGYLKDIFSKAQEQYYGGGLSPAYYPGQTVAGMDPATQTALSLQEQRALAGNPAMNAANAQLQSTMQGDYLAASPFTTSSENPYADFTNPYAYTGNNPYAYNEANNPFANTEGNAQLDAMVQRATGQALANVNSQAAAGGRYGSGAQAAAAQDAAGNIATQMYGQAYENDQNRALQAWNTLQNQDFGAWQALQNQDLQAWNTLQNQNYNAWNSIQDRAMNAWNTERENQMRAMFAAPQMAAQDYSDIAALSEVGTARENYAQQALNEEMAKYNYNANRDLYGLQNYMNLIQGNYGGTTSSTASNLSTGRSNPLGGVASGAMAGAGLGSMIPGIGTGLGALIGGAGGGLLSLF